MSDEEDRNYSVGYGKPPQHTRFQKGQSGNPKGRPLGSSNRATLLDKALNERVIVKKNGRQRKISMAELIVQRVVNKAASGDWGPLKYLSERLLGSGEESVASFPIGKNGKPIIPVTVIRDILLMDERDADGHKRWS